MSKGSIELCVLTWATLASLLSLACSQLDLTSLTATNYTLRATSNYTLTFFSYQSAPVPLNSSLLVTFDTAYIGLINSPSCFSPSFGGAPLSCTFLYNNLTIPTLYTSNYLNVKSFTIIVAGITNPSPAKDYVPVNYFALLSPGGSKSQDGTSGKTVTIAPLSAQCTTSTLNAIVFQRGQITINYNSSYISGTTNSSYYLNIAVPTFYSDDSTQTLINPNFSSTVVSSQPSASQYVYSLEYVTSLIVTLLMPPSTKPQPDILTVSSYDKANSGTLDSCSLSLSNIQPSSFSKATIAQSTVQSYSNTQFNLVLPTPLSQSDQLQLNFSSAFDLSRITISSVNMSGYTNSFALSRYANLLVLTANLTQPYLNAELLFTLPLLGLPFTTTPQQIGISLITEVIYYRISQTIAYSALAGTLTVAANCLTTEIGTPTSCLFSIATSNSLTSNMTVVLALPNDFNVMTGSANCAINGKNLNSVGLCLYSAVTNTITATNLNSTSANISPLNFTLNISLTLSQKVGNYQITVTTMSAGQSVDTGKAGLNTTARALKSSQFSVYSSTSTTKSPTNYSITLATPFDLGYSYTLMLGIPVDPQDGLSPTITNATLQGYQNQTLNVTASNLASTNFLVQNLKSPISTSPATVTLLISYGGVVQFTATQTITMNALQTIQILTIAQSNQIVYKQFIATVSISGLAASDYIRISANYSPFYAADQSACSTSVVSCLGPGLLKVIQPSNGSTVFNVSLINQPFIGSYSLSVSVYDSLNTYGKQAGTSSLAATVTNSIAVGASQTNPYLNQTSTYTFNLTFSTPNATQLYCLAPAFTVSSVQCNLNCGTPYFLAGYYIFSLSSTWALIQFAVINPEQFNSSTKFSFRTASSQGDKDYAQYQPQAVCASTCRSCSSLGSSACTSCYSWSTLPYLYNATCVSYCPVGTFISAATCSPCATICSRCYANSTNCSLCVTGYYLMINSCVSACPSNSYLNPSTSSCVACAGPCATCSGNTTNCTSCLLNFNNSAYFYLGGVCYTQQCPITFYSSVTNNSCYACPPNCYSCNASACLSCPSSNYIYNGICYSTCPTGTYTLDSTHCTQCVPPCSTCSALTVCSGCVDGYSLYNGGCIAGCPTYYYSTSGVCMACSPPCLLCNATGCISCSNTSNYMSGQSCVSTCSAPLHPNNHSLICQTCLPPCKDCTWSDFCLTCISAYSLMNNTCLSACPLSYYSDVAATCQPCPPTCTACSMVSQRPLCSGCVNGTLIFSWDCVYECPANSSASGSYCVSLNCSELEGCLSCSGYRCLQCNSLYVLGSNYSCSYNLGASAVLSALSHVPVPFPFLIATLVVILLAFLLKHNYPKMFAPLFIYAVGGVLEQLCLVLWTVLALLWNANIAYPLPMISVVYGTALILIGYGLMNVVEAIVWRVRIATDRKYRQWELQDNRCASVGVWFLSIILSFRLDTLKYSRTAHSERLSARLSSTDKFRHYTVMAILGILINSCSILVAAYISYLQNSMNYLFFSCLEVAILSVFMIIFAIALLCVPTQQLLEFKTDYKLGTDQAQLEGTSLQEVLSGLAVAEEEHDFNREVCSQSGSAVMAKQSRSYQNISSQKLTDQEIGFRDEEGQEAAHRNPAYSKGTQQEIIFEHQSQQEISHILLDQIQANHTEAVEINNTYLLSQTSPQSLYHKPTVANPRKPNLPPTHADSEIQGDYEQFEIGYQNNAWLFHRRAQSLGKDGTGYRRGKVDELQIMRTLAEPVAGEEKVWGQQVEGGVTEDGEVFDVLVGETFINNEEDEQARQAAIQKEKQLLKEIENLHALQRDCLLVEQQHKAEAERLMQLQAEESQLQEKLSRHQLQARERKLMEVEDRLSRAAQIAESLNQKLNSHRTKIRSKKIEEKGTRKRQQPQQQNESILATQSVVESFEYRNKDEVNLPTEYCPKKIKISPRPDLQMYRKQHIYEERNEEISEQSQDQAHESFKKVQRLQNTIVQKPKQVIESHQQISKDFVVHQKNQHLSYLQEKEFQRRQQSFKTKTAAKKEIKQPKKETKLPNKETKLSKDERQIGNNPLVSSKEAKLKPNSQQKQMQRALGRVKYSQEHKVLQLQNESDGSQSKQKQEKPELEGEKDIVEQSKQEQQNEAVQAGAEKDKDEFVLQQSQITVFKHEIIKVESSERSLASFSDDSHWPMEPQLQQRINEVNRKADHYIRQPRPHSPHSTQPKHNEFIASATQSNYEEDDQIDNNTIPQILFQQCAEPTPSEVRSAKTRVRTGRVNRRVIDLSPE